MHCHLQPSKWSHAETHVDHQSIKNSDYETRLEHDDDPPNENNDHETMFGEKKNNSLVTLWKALGFIHNGIIPYPRQPHHTLKEAIQAQVISLQLDIDFGKSSISIQDKIVMRIFLKHTKNDKAITIDAIANHANMVLG